MVLVLENGEEIVFKHRCKLGNVSGELLVTTLRLAWTPSIPKEASDFQSPWSNIKGMVFSPPTDPKVATKVDTLVGAGSGGKGMVFYLEGTDKEKELLRLKGEFKKIRSSNKLLSTAPPSASVVSASSSSSSYSGAKRSAAQTIINESGEDAQKQARLKQRKLNLLSADKQLAKSYRELVESTHIVSEEEFWSMHVNPSLLEDKETQVQRQGRLTIVDIIKNSTKTSADGLLSISLNQDDRQSLLDSDPAARRAFAELVPLQKKESEFWVLYFEKWINGTTPQTEELFSRFEDRSTLNSAGGGSRAQFEREGGGLELDFNLIKNHDDFYGSESFAAEDLCHELKKDIAQLNNESQRVIQPLRQGPKDRGRGSENSSSSSCSGSGSGLNELYASDLPELRDEKEPAYMPLRLSRTAEDASVDAAAAAAAAGASAAPVAAPVPVVSAFGKATSAVARGVSRRPPYVPKSAAEIVASLQTTFPSAERAFAAYTQNRTALRSASALASLGQGQGQGATMSSGYEEFKQDILEHFIQVTELLRHFFAVMHRTGAQAPRPGTETAHKVDQITERLMARRELLQAKAKAIKDTRRFSDSEVDSSTVFVNELVKLITRANDRWTSYKSRDS